MYKSLNYLSRLLSPRGKEQPECKTTRHLMALALLVIAMLVPQALRAQQGNMYDGNHSYISLGNSNDNSTTYYQNHANTSLSYHLPSGYKMHLEFANYHGSNDGNNDHNWALLLVDDNGNFALGIRPDWWWWTSNEDQYEVPNFTVGENNWVNWDGNFNSQMENAYVTMDITYQGGVATVYTQAYTYNGNTKGSEIYHQTFYYNLGAQLGWTPSTLHPRLVVNYSHLNVFTDTYTLENLSGSNTAYEEYDFEAYAKCFGGYNLAYTGNESNGVYLVNDGWLDGKFSVAGRYNNYWQMSANNGLVQTNTEDNRNFAINGLSKGDIVTIHGNGGYIVVNGDNVENISGWSWINYGTQCTMSADGQMMFVANGGSTITKVTIERSTIEEIDYWDYSNATDVSPWQSPNVTLTLGGSDGNHYVDVSPGTASGDRSAYNASLTSGGKSQYTFEFDAQILGGYGYDSDKSQFSQLAVLTESFTGTNNKYTGSNFLFKLEQTGKASSYYYINGTSNTVQINSSDWYHYTLNVNTITRKVEWSIYNYSNNSTVASGSYDIPSGVNTEIKELYFLSGRAQGWGHFNKLKVTGPNEPGLSFAEHTATAYISDVNFHEPTLYYSPKSATVNFTSSNTTIAKVDATGNVMMLAGGEVTITATMTTSGQTYTDSYTLNIHEEVGDFIISGNTATTFNKGKFGERQVLGVPFITMETGNIEEEGNITLIREVAGISGNVVTTLADDGWHDVQFDANKKPVQGSFFVFKPEVKGHLSFTGYMTGNNTLMLVDATALTTNLITSPSYSSNTTPANISNVQLQAGHTYYLFGKNPLYDDASHTWDAGYTEGWCVYQLQSFTFVPDYRFEHDALVYRDNKLYDINGNEVTAESTWPQGVQQAVGTVTYTYKTVGDVHGSVSSTGAITLDSSDTGGAYVVTATDGATGMQAFYTLTIPYNEHIWDFTSAPEVSNLTANKPYGATYGFNSQHNQLDDNGRIYDLDEPMVSNKLAMDGENAVYLESTAGLLISASDKKVGHQAIYASGKSVEEVRQAAINAGTLDPNSGSYARDLHLLISDMVNTYDETDFQTLTTLNIGYNTKIVIPYATTDQYIKVHWHRHTSKNGGTFRVTNLSDLEGTPVDKDFEITSWSSNTDWTNPKGVYIFKPTTNGPVSFQMVDKDGWTGIAKIELTSEYSTDLRLCIDDGKVKVQSTDGAYPDVASLVWDGTNGVELVFQGAASYTDGENGTTSRFSYETEGNIPASSIDTEEYSWVSNGGVTYYNYRFGLTGAGTGNVKIIQKVYSTSTDGSNTNYVFDKQETWLAVGQITPQTYPITWDFTGDNMSAEQAATSFSGMSGTSANATNYGAWNVEDGTYSLAGYTANDGQKPLFAVGSELTAGTTPIVETKGLGISPEAVGPSYREVIQLDGQKLSGVRAITLPALTKSGDKDLYVYVKASKSPTAEISEGAAFSTVSNTASGVYGYKITSGSNATMKFNFSENTDIYKIGVTDVAVAFNDFGGKGYTTAYYPQNVRFDLCEYFTGTEVTAQTVTEATMSNSDSGKLTLTDVEVAPASTPLLLTASTTGNGSSNKMPLFAKNVNTAESTVSGTNYLVGSTSRTTVPTGSYILTNKYQDIVNGVPQGGSKEGKLAWYKVYGTNYVKANGCYLTLPASSNGARVYYFFDWDDDVATGIDAAQSELNEQGEQGEYFNLSGQKINGKPAQKGIYVKNGKKVFVK